MNIDNIFYCFPENIVKDIKKQITIEEINTLEEIRIRNNRPIIMKIEEREKVLEHITNIEEINYIFQKICENSIYSYQNQIIQGFITINGGNRVGIVGSAVIKEEKVINFNYISSLNFRIGRQVIGCSNKIIKEIINVKENNIYNTLIISPPGGGKTTLLRDIVRNISNGIEGYLKGLDTAVIDERGEIAAMYKGIMQNDLGIRTDVINNVPKVIGMKLAIRSMAPKVIVADEIGGLKESETIQYAMCSGVKGIFTAHGKNMEDIFQNKEIKELIKNNFFERIIIIERNKKYIVKNI